MVRQTRRILSFAGLALLVASLAFPWLEFTIETSSGNETEFSAFAWGRRTIHDGPTVANRGEAQYQSWFELDLPGSASAKVGMIVFGIGIAAALIPLFLRSSKNAAMTLALRWAPSSFSTIGTLLVLLGFWQQRSHAERVFGDIGGTAGAITPLLGIALPVAAIAMLELPAWLGKRAESAVGLEHPNEQHATKPQPRPFAKAKAPAKSKKKWLIASAALLVLLPVGFGVVAYGASKPDVTWHARNERRTISSEGFTQGVGVERDSTIGFEFDAQAGSLVSVCVVTAVYDFADEETTLGCVTNAPGGRKEYDVDSGQYLLKFTCATGATCEVVFSIWEKRA